MSALDFISKPIAIAGPSTAAPKTPSTTAFNAPTMPQASVSSLISKPISSVLKTPDTEDFPSKVISTFPFTDSAKNIVSKIPIVEADPARRGAPSQTEYGPDNKPSRITINSLKNPDDQLHLAHEYFNTIFSNDSINPESFNSAWDKALKEDPRLAGIDAQLNSPQNASLFKGGAGREDISDPFYKATERFAFAGSMLGVDGISSIPKSLQPFYKAYLQDFPTTENKSGPHISDADSKDILSKGGETIGPNDVSLISDKISLPKINDLKTSSGITAESNEIDTQKKQLDAELNSLDKTSQASVDAFNTKITSFNNRLDSYKEAVNAYNKNPEKGPVENVPKIGTAGGQSTPGYAPHTVGVPDPFSLLPGVNAIAESVHEGSIKPAKDYLKQKIATLGGGKIDDNGNFVSGSLKDRLIAAENLTIALGTTGEGETASSANAKAIAKSTDEIVISRVLQKEIPVIGPDQANELAKVFKHINTPEDVTTALNRIKSQISDVPKTAPRESINGTVSEPVTSAAGAIPQSLQPLAEEAKKYKTVDEMLPPELRGSEILQTKIFGSSIKGGKYNDIDAAVLVPEPKFETPEIRENVFDLTDHKAVIQHGGIEYHIFPNTPRGRSAMDWFTGNGEHSPVSIDLKDFYNKATGRDTTNLPAPHESTESKLATARATLSKAEGKAGVDSTPGGKIKAVSEAVDKTRTELEIAKSALEEHPAKPLMKYVNKATGEIPEVLGGSKTAAGKKTGKFAKKGDDIATEHGFKDSEAARRSYDDYLKQRRRVSALDQQLRDLKLVEKNKKIQQADIEAARKFLDKGANKTQKEIEAHAKKTMGDKLDRMQKRIEERREEAHANLRKLEKDLSDVAPGIDMETLSLQALADQASSIEYANSPSLSKIMIDTATSVKQKVGLLDYLRTPDRVLQKIGLGKNAREIRTAYENYLSELPQHIEVLQEWYDRALKHDGSDYKIFQYLDGKMKATDLNPEENLVAQEIKEYLKDWAYRLGLPEDDQVSHYITHIFDKQIIEKEFDEDLAKIIRNKVPGSVYDPFLEKRMGMKGYVQSTRRALEAYMKRAVRKANMDPALERLKEATTLPNGDPRLELSQYNYVKKFADRVNLRPTDIDNLLDNSIKQIFGYRFGQRPTASLTRTLRQFVYRGMLGLNFGSAIKNLTQGVNTYAKLGEKYTVIGYTKLIANVGSNELVENNILSQDIVQDQTVSAVKRGLQKADKGLFILFEMAEKINRGAAYWGAKSKAIDEGMSEEAAIDYAKKLVRDTQFAYGQIDTPVALQSDIAKTFAQFGNFVIKQGEFLGEMGKNYKKEWAGLLRYIIGSIIIVQTLGRIFNIKYSDFIPNPVSRFGTPPSLGLPVAIFQSLLPNQVDKYGKPMGISQKATSIGNAAIPYIPAGIQAQKSYKGLQAYFGGKVDINPLNLFKATVSGSYGLPKQTSFTKAIENKYAAKSQNDFVKNIEKKYKLK